jgi:uncharacterized YigZ family protein
MHVNAGHYCYAYRIKEIVLQERYQDDKEPSGTAGMPILEVLKGNQLTQCAIVVVRYFGGIKLGTGGLSRAYSDAAREVLQLGTIVSIDVGNYLAFEVDYHLIGKIDYLLTTYQIPIDSVSYDTKVKYCIIVPSALVANIEKQLNDITSGQIGIECVKANKGFFGICMFTPL